MNILAYHIGSLGDTLVAVPALWALRKSFPDARITMLTDEQPGRALVQAWNILDGSGLIDDYIVYPVGSRLALAKLLLRLRRAKFDCLAYLIRCDEKGRRARRDRVFFRLAGIRRLIGMSGQTDAARAQPEGRLGRSPHVTDVLLRRLAAAGLNVDVTESCMSQLRIGLRDQDRVDDWLRGQSSDGGRRWVGVGIGGKMPVNIWPIDRYRQVVTRLIEDYDVWPVVFAGPENQKAGQQLVDLWQRGYVACGELGVRVAIAAMSRCCLFLGNDTGTMHMAAASGIPCVGVYSSRNQPGLWHPYGDGHFVFRTPVPCEGCMLETCPEHDMKCILSISVEDVLAACSKILVDATHG